ncbi:eIF2 kinase Gcn2p negative regulator [Arthrobotrys conoides]|uniref:EIF2 kinase Gcn2p negative regulator n=1 Tax=Arthrobotrys conoides TaxID=74498 RepID=A0AAN8NED5_9PEZI
MSSGDISQDLLDEITSLNSIYAEDTLKLQQPPLASDIANSTSTSSSTHQIEAGEAVCILSPPSSEINPPVSLTIKFPRDYPASPPTILSGTTFGKGLSKDEVTHLSRDVLHNVWLEGVVVLFDLLEGLKELLHNDSFEAAAPISPPESVEVKEIVADARSVAAAAVTVVSSIPWTITPITTVSKSQFVGRCVRVTSAETAKQHIAELISTDRKVARATHNITEKINWKGFEICNIASNWANEHSGADNDDDGETAAGSRLGHLLDMIDVWNVLVIVSRWYGGIKLGPDRFRIINQIAREALVLGEFIDEHGNTKGDTGDSGKGKKKKGKHH